eukprot:136099-Pyramimonas_sp.AAC.1
MEGATDRLQKDWAKLYKGNVITWFPLNVIVYGFIPLERRVLAFSTCTLLFSIGLSLWSESPDDAGDADEISTKEIS